MMVFISCIAFIHGNLFFSKTAADIHTDGSQNSSSLLLFLTLAVHSTALNNGAFDSRTKNARGLSCWAISDSLDSLMNTSQYTHDRPPPGTTAAYISLKLDSSIRLQQFACMFRDKASCRVTLILREEYSLLFGWAIRQ